MVGEISITGISRGLFERLVTTFLTLSSENIESTLVSLYYCHDKNTPAGSPRRLPTGVFYSLFLHELRLKCLQSLGNIILPRMNPEGAKLQSGDKYMIPNQAGELPLHLWEVHDACFAGLVKISLGCS